MTSISNFVKIGALFQRLKGHTKPTQHSDLITPLAFAINGKYTKRLVSSIQLGLVMICN
jgi:hypothetical protein